MPYKIINLNTENLYSTLPNLSISNIKSIPVLKEEQEVIKEETTIKKEPIIYIYNTHDSEKYHSDFISDYSITPGVKVASLILKDYLNNLGVESVVETSSASAYVKKYNLSYSSSYDASRKFIKNAQTKNNFKILIDIHRDSSKRKTTLYEKDNKKYAKIMFVLAKKNKNYKQNEKFIKEINAMLDANYKGISRGIYERDDVIFNQDLSPNATLIELGGVDNTLEEINNTLEILAKILSEYIRKNINE